MFNAQTHQVLSAAYFGGRLVHKFRFRNLIGSVDMFSTLEYIRGTGIMSQVPVISQTLAHESVLVEGNNFGAAGANIATLVWFILIIRLCPKRLPASEGALMTTVLIDGGVRVRVTLLREFG